MAGCWETGRHGPQIPILGGMSGFKMPDAQTAVKQQGVVDAWNCSCGQEKVMIEIRLIDSLHKADINIPNEPFELRGRMIPSYNGEKWDYTISSLPKEKVTQMCFPDENYCFEEMDKDLFLGAYDGDRCVGLAIFEPGFFKYLYLYDLKVNKNYRRQHIGTMLMEEGRKLALQRGYSGIYAVGQDNNLDACLFYINSGFYIGGLDTNVYRHTNQEEKKDIIFYSESVSDIS